MMTKRKERRVHSRLFACLAALGLGSMLPLSVHAGPQEFEFRPHSRSLANGSFEQGLTGWKAVPAARGSGLASGLARYEVVDPGWYGWDENVFTATVVSEAAWNPDADRGSQWSSHVVLERSARVQGRYLSFHTFALFEFFLQRHGQVGYTAKLEVEGVQGRHAEYVLLDELVVGQHECGIALQALGIIPDERHALDLLAQGFSMGEFVTVRFVWSATAAAREPCDDGRFQGFLALDEFEFSSQLSDPLQLPLDDWVRVPTGG